MVLIPAPTCFLRIGAALRILRIHISTQTTSRSALTLGAPKVTTLPSPLHVTVIFCKEGASCACEVYIGSDAHDRDLPAIRYRSALGEFIAHTLSNTAGIRMTRTALYVHKGGDSTGRVPLDCLQEQTHIKDHLIPPH